MAGSDDAHAAAARAPARAAPPYLINLDPAVLDTPFGAIDIKDTVNYHEVMKQYQLGPSGILTALNLFATRFEQVMTLVEARRRRSSTWCRHAGPDRDLAGRPPANHRRVARVVVPDRDRVRRRHAVLAESRHVHSNMLYACSILYKMKLPLVLAFNKTDVATTLPQVDVRLRVLPGAAVRAIVRRAILARLGALGAQFYPRLRLAVAGTWGRSRTRWL